MFFLNLSAGEFLALLGALGGLITALYLLDRAKRKKVVSTLRFWTSAGNAEEKQTRKRMRDPWSLILQLASLCLLLLAIAQLQWGTRERRGRDHVVLIDTSSWSAEIENGATLLGRERALAQNYVSRLPARDRVLVAEADALVTPLVAFTADHSQITSALRAAASAHSALNIDQALRYAQQAQTWSGGQPGEIVYVGPGLIDSDEQSAPSPITNLRVLSVAAQHDNAGIVHMAVNRSVSGAGEWQAFVTVRNYSPNRRPVRLRTHFGASRFADRLLNLAPNQDAVASYIFDTERAGQFVAALDPTDALPDDDRAGIALPRNGPLRIAVFSQRPDAWRPLLQADPRISARFFGVDQYRAKPDADMVLLDNVRVPQPPLVPTLWVMPADADSPLPVKAHAENTTITTWNDTAFLAAGLRTREARLATAELFQTFDGDSIIAGTPLGAVVVARPAAAQRRELAVLGFDPLAGDMKFQVVTPLLFSNLLRWLLPESFQSTEFSAERLGAATVMLDAGERPEKIRLRTVEGSAVPFTIHAQILQLFVARPAIVNISSPARERVLSLTLPAVAQHHWQTPANAFSGLPRPSSFQPMSVTLWQALAVAAAMGIFAEWLLFGRRKAGRHARVSPRRPSVTPRVERDRELVTR